MEPSAFTVRSPLPGRDEVFLLNTLTDAQAVVSSDVVALLDRLEHPAPSATLSDDEQAAVAALAGAGFVVESRMAEREAVERFFAEFRDDTSELRVTVLTTLECNLACDYCIQGDHAEARGDRMSVATAERVAGWITSRLDALNTPRFVLTFFGGEPLVNLPVVYLLAERLWSACDARGVTMLVNVITNGVLLSPEVVDRLSAWGLNGVKVTLDGDREMHDARRPRLGGQGSFDRIIANLRAVAGRCRLTIGGNVDEQSLDRFPALIAFLREQAFAESIVKVNFKPIIRTRPAVAAGTIPLTVVDATGRQVGGPVATSGGCSPCDTCGFVDESLAAIRAEIRRAGFPVPDGVHLGPCELHKEHAYTVGPDGSLFACPGFADDRTHAVGHIASVATKAHDEAATRFAALAAWRRCGDCGFIPVCGGGCAVAAHHELGDMHAPSCHKRSFETALAELAADVASPG